jgi:hypothetical protein
MAKSKNISYYNSIDELPIFNWFAIEEKNDITFLLKDKKEITPDQRALLLVVWDSLIAQYIDEFGISDSMQEIMLVKKYIKILEIDQELYGINNTTFIEIELERLKELSQKGQNISNNEVKAYVEKYMGFRLDPKVITVKEYFYYLRVMNKENSTPKQSAKNG